MVTEQVIAAAIVREGVAMGENVVHAASLHERNRCQHAPPEALRLRSLIYALEAAALIDDDVLVPQALQLARLITAPPPPPREATPPTCALAQRHGALHRPRLRFRGRYRQTRQTSVACNYSPRVSPSFVSPVVETCRKYKLRFTSE